MYRDSLAGELSLASWVGEHWLWGAADLGPPEDTWVFEMLVVCVLWLTSYVARRLGCMPSLSP